MKKMMWALFWLNLLICLFSLTFFGVPDSVQELIERVCRMIVSASSGAAMFSAASAVRSLRELDVARQELQSLSNGHSSQHRTSKTPGPLDSDRP